jgi:hypothetical protein
MPAAVCTSATMVHLFLTAEQFPVTVLATTTINGGGVHIVSGGTFIMLDGTISGNSANNGGGIFVASGGTFNIVSGTVHGNESTTTESLRNNRRAMGASLFNNGTSEFGTYPSSFTGTVASLGTFSPNGNIGISEFTIDVSNGIITRPDRPLSGELLADHLRWLRAFGQIGTPYDINVSTQSISPANATLPANLTIRLVANAASTISLTENGTLFEVGAGTTLEIGDNITLMGRGPTAVPVSTANNNPVVRVLTGGRFIMRGNATITGNTNTQTGDVARGGGVNVNGGLFDMFNGVIFGNSLTGATTGLSGAGVLVSNNGTFNMHNGVIRNNAAVAGNSAGGVYVINSEFNMHGGSIRDNTNSSTGSGGVLIHTGTANATFNMYTGATITGNTVNAANSGGGVNINAGSATITNTFNMFGGTISNNTTASTANTPNAGGVRVGGTGTVFNMRGITSTISGNTSNSLSTQAQNGSAGGVTIIGAGEFNISDGIIYGNNSGTNSNTIAATANASFNFAALYRQTAATGARRGTFNDAGVFIPATGGSILENSNDTIHILGGIVQ